MVDVIYFLEDGEKEDRYHLEGYVGTGVVDNEQLSKLKETNTDQAEDVHMRKRNAVQSIVSKANGNKYNSTTVFDFDDLFQSVVQKRGGTRDAPNEDNVDNSSSSSSSSSSAAPREVLPPRAVAPPRTVAPPRAVAPPPATANGANDEPPAKRAKYDGPPPGWVKYQSASGKSRGFYYQPAGDAWWDDYELAFADAKNEATGEWDWDHAAEIAWSKNDAAAGKYKK